VCVHIVTYIDQVKLC